MSSDLELLERLRQEAANGSSEALGKLLLMYRSQLRQLLSLRLDPRLQKRVDPSDVIQETCIEAVRRIDEHLSDTKTPFYIWLRFLTLQKLHELHRQHLGTRSRDLSREISLFRQAAPEASSELLAAQLIGRCATPSNELIRAEMRLQLQQSLEAMDPHDREIITLRHFEELTNAEVASVLGVNESTASSRFWRALKRLRSLLSTFPGFFERLSQGIRLGSVPPPEE